MMILKLAIVAGLAALTQSFLLPPEVSTSDTQLIDSLPVEAAVYAQGQLQNLECVGCLAPSTDAAGHIEWTTNIASQLKLFFSIKQTENGDILSLNDYQLFPPMPLMGPLTAGQVTKDNTVFRVRLGYQLIVEPTIHDPENRLELIPLNFQVVEVADVFVNGLQSIDIRLIKAPDGSLLIASINLAETQNPLVNPTENGEKCKNLICAWRAALSDRLAKFRNRLGAKGGERPERWQKHEHHGHGHHGGPNHHPFKHHRCGGIYNTVKRIIHSVVIPMLIGIVAGVGACVLGTMVGSLIVFVWRAVYRRGQRGYCCCRVQQEAIDVKAPLLEEESPPAYEDDVADEKATDNMN